MVASRRARRGNVCVLVAFSLVFIIGAAAIAIDGGLLMDDLQKAQAAADASAMAAATELFKNWQSDNGFDRSNQARDAALELAATNGFPNDGTDSVITPNEVDGDGKPLHGIWCPPISGTTSESPASSRWSSSTTRSGTSARFMATTGSRCEPVRSPRAAGGRRTPAYCCWTRAAAGH